MWRHRCWKLQSCQSPQHVVQPQDNWRLYQYRIRDTQNCRDSSEGQYSICKKSILEQRDPHGVTLKVITRSLILAGWPGQQICHRLLRFDDVLSPVWFVLIALSLWHLTMWMKKVRCDVNATSPYAGFKKYFRSKYFHLLQRPLISSVFDFRVFLFHNSS